MHQIGSRKADPCTDAATSSTATTTTTNAESTAGHDYEALTNTLKPITDCFLTIRVIKSFEYRTTKNVLLPHVNARETTVGQLKDLVRDRESAR